ncbi:MAG: TonB family protein [Pyrinomonadaceae bacterium]|nr:TonB family protein [Pyrinomonadaceae bacterium]
MKLLLRAGILLALFILWPVLLQAQNNDRPFQPAAPPPLPTPTPRPAPTDADGWKIIFLTERSYGSFKVPGEPTTLSNEINTSAGRLTQNIYVLKTDDAIYYVSHVKFPVAVTDAKTIREALDSGLKRLLGAGQNIEVLSEREIKIGSSPGKAWMLRNEYNVVQVRAFMAGRDIYFMTLSMPRQMVLKADKPDVSEDNLTESYQARAKKFFGSLQLYGGGVGYGGGSAIKGTAPKSEGGAKTVSGGVLNKKALSLPKPKYPDKAQAQGITGSVVVQVTVDEEGRVIAAKAITGNTELQGAAEEAARKARFAPTKSEGQPARVTGVLVYNFAF